MWCSIVRTRAPNRNLGIVAMNQQLTAHDDRPPIHLRHNDVHRRTMDFDARQQARGYRVSNPLKDGSRAGVDIEDAFRPRSTKWCDTQPHEASETNNVDVMLADSTHQALARRRHEPFWYAVVLKDAGRRPLALRRARGPRHRRSRSTTRATRQDSPENARGFDQRRRR